MDAMTYLAAVKAAYARRGAATVGSDEHANLDLFVNVLGWLRVSWRHKVPGFGAPHLFFASAYVPGPDRTAVTPAWVDFTLDDARAARAAHPDRIIGWDACVLRPAACCEADAPLICSYDARCVHAAPFLPNECLATLCLACCRMELHRP